ncbi:hypothetical protein HWV00_08915 [Moritella sp. 24]|uniref:DUF5522 domain-containing protein n=1 Tax=Moritella sp. 24 TaxID=2746230 RepID=UPI001BA72855|nr:DUF5522 domain-containing protein [Moritella sp. 24]QUM76330.1 hypothetical protein HWV00_08915 [Moritella sp. 24]
MAKPVVDTAVNNIEQNEVNSMQAELVSIKKTCSQCQTEFGCGVTAASETSSTEQSGCWCQSLPAVMPLDELSDCLCQSCLAKAVGAEIIKQLDAAGSPKARLAIAEPYRHQTELVENVDFTIENGLYVFSEWYHLKRARCCGNNCRHCAYK